MANSKYDEKKAKELLKKRIAVMSPDDYRAHKSNNKSRMRYGTCSHDAYNLDSTLGEVIHNYILQYIADGSQAIVRDDKEWALMEAHAEAIKEYSQADSLDQVMDIKDDDGISLSIKYNEKERKWREAMFWLTENWRGLWW